MTDNFMTKVFEYVSSITLTKKNIMYGEEDEKFYVKARWMIHRALSFSPDLIQTVNLVNGLHGMDARTEYEFFLNFVAIKPRRNKWYKKSPKSVFMNAVRQHYGYNETKAEEAMKLLTVEQMTMIDNKNKKEDSWTYSGDSVSKSP